MRIEEGLGEVIRAAREGKGYSQKKLATLVETDQTTIQRIENEVTKFSYKLPKILKALALDNIKNTENNSKIKGDGAIKIDTININITIDTFNFYPAK